MKYLKHTILFSAFAGLVAISGCSKDEENTLKMGVSADYPPFEFLYNDTIQGFDIELAENITTELGYKLEIIDMDYSGLLPALTTGRVDFIMSAIEATPERAENVDFSEVYYNNSPVLLYKTQTFKDLSEKAAFESSLLAFSGKSYGVQQSSTFERFINTKQSLDSSVKVHAVARIPLLLEDLKLGRVDALIVDSNVARDALTRIPGFSYVEMSDDFFKGVAIAFPKGSELVEQFNAVILAMKETGALAELEAKWFEPQVLTDAEVNSIMDDESVSIPSENDATSDATEQQGELKSESELEAAIESLESSSENSSAVDMEPQASQAEADLNTDAELPVEEEVRLEVESKLESEVNSAIDSEAAATKDSQTAN